MGEHGQQYAARVVQIVLGVRLVGEGQLQSFQQRDGHLDARVAGHYGHELQGGTRAADHRGHEFQGEDLAVGPVLGLALPALAVGGSGLGFALPISARLGVPALAVNGSGFNSAFLHRIFRTSAGLRMAFDLARLSLQNRGRFAVRTFAPTRGRIFIGTVALPRSRLTLMCAAYPEPKQSRRDSKQAQHGQTQTA